MGLDQTLEWYGKPSKDQVSRLHHKCISDFGSNGLNYLDEESANEEKYRFIRKFMIPEEVYHKECDWKLIKKECGVPEDTPICGIGGHSVSFGRAMNTNDVKTFQINTYDKRFWKPVLHTDYFFCNEEAYRWRNNYDIQDIFNEAYPDAWYEYKQKYGMHNCGVYKLTKTLLNKMCKVDPVFAAKYDGEINNIFYSANW